jgi:hypothetical protein
MTCIEESRQEMSLFLTSRRLQFPQVQFMLVSLTRKGLAMTLLQTRWALALIALGLLLVLTLLITFYVFHTSSPLPVAILNHNH